MATRAPQKLYGMYEIGIIIIYLEMCTLYGVTLKSFKHSLHICAFLAIFISVSVVRLNCDFFFPVTHV